MNEFVVGLVNTVLFGILTVVFTKVLPPVMKKGMEYIDKKQTNEAMFQENIVLNRVVDFIQDIVMEVMQTYVEPLKANDGWTPQSHSIAFDLAMDKIKSVLSNETKELIIALYGDLESYLTTQIERAVSENRNKEYDTKSEEITGSDSE